MIFYRKLKIIVKHISEHQGKYMYSHLRIMPIDSHTVQSLNNRNGQHFRLKIILKGIAAFVKNRLLLSKSTHGQPKCFSYH